MSWSWASASSIGTSHSQNGGRCEDFHKCGTLGSKNEVFFGILCDGAGSALHGGFGARYFVRSILNLLRAHYAHSNLIPTHDLWASWVSSTREKHALAAERLGHQPKDFAATLVAFVCDGMAISTCQIGDGCIVAKESYEGMWQAMTWPENGEYASTTFFITDTPEPRIQTFKNDIGISSVVAFTDGIENLALKHDKKEPFSEFFDAIVAPVQRCAQSGRNRKLSDSLEKYLSSELVTSRTDDDTTIVISAKYESTNC